MKDMCYDERDVSSYWSYWSFEHFMQHAAGGWPGEERKNSEKRKEKSRDAARCRRSRETEIFTDLAQALPMPQSTISQLDKASIMRLAISYLKVRSLLNLLPETCKAKLDSTNDPLFLRALEGFLLVVSADGDMIFLSENINEYLGITQIDLMGHSIYEFSHPCDHDEIRDILSIKSPLLPVIPRSFFIRMKCTLTSKGRNVNLKSATYKVIHCTGHVLASPSCKKEIKTDCGADSDNNNNNQQQHCLVAIGEPIPHPSNIEIPLDHQTFLSKHNLDMKFTYADDRIGEFLGYNPEELLGKSVYEYHHALDSEAVEKGFKSLFSKGQCETGVYRFLAKNGGYVWVLTQATLIYGSKTGQKPHSVVCVNFVVSGIEHKDEVYSCSQLTSSEQLVEPDVKPIVSTNDVIVPTIVSRPQVVTAKIFAQAPTIPARVPSPSPVSITTSTPAPSPPGSSTSSSLDSTPIPELPLFTSNIRPQAVTSKLFAPVPTVASTHSPTSNRTPVKVASGLESSPPPLVPLPTSFSRPQAATSKIFAPRTEEMNKGFLMFSEEEPGLTMLKDEPEDLTHLAPTAGDVDVPLETNCFMSDMFDDFILSDGYCPLLTEELNTLSDSQSSHSSSNKGDGSNSSDPFFSYREETSSSGGSPNSALHSPALSKSPGDCSLPSLCSPGDSGDDNNMTPFLSLNLENTNMSDMDEDLSMRAPYIPMGVGDDFPLLMSTDLMWGALPDKPLSSKTNSSNKNNRWCTASTTSVTKTTIESNLAQLLCADNTVQRSSRPPPVKCNDHGGGLVDPSEVLGQVLTKEHRTAPTGSMEWTAIPGLPLQRLLPQKGGGSMCPSSNLKKNNCGSAGPSERPCKRSCTPTTDEQYTTAGNKRTKNELKTPQKLPSQLLQQLIQTNGTQNVRTKGPRADSVWVLDGGGTSASNKQQEHHPKQPPPVPSDSVLMNLLGNPRRKKGVGPHLQESVADINLQHCKSISVTGVSRVVQCDTGTCTIDEGLAQRKANIRKNSFSLLDPEGATIPSLVDLSQRDYDVNAPVSSGLLQGQDLLKALETSSNALMD
ncbi:hypoxia-inducible factor 1-alpha-like isoform X2 [Periplaneta americana]|uniref:hypoxia-inducible factor 1-alpha-like isoform X2 n=1 Tax=Periplaneta americana TaxID=6978 RepID=UPI0037E795DA